MAYSAGMMNKRIVIAKRSTGPAPSAATDTGKARYEILATVWASETWNKGAKSMQAGVLDAYDTVMFRMRYRSDIDRWCLIQYHGKWYQIQSLNSDYHDNQLQITATEMANQKITIVEPIYVDLGLPSGTLWARWNVGATKETEVGNFYKYGLGATKYDKTQADYEGDENPLDAQHDTATQVMGSPWHMPTQTQMIELLSNTTFSWERNFNGSGINGGKFTAENGKYIFFPASGRYYDGVKYNEDEIGYYFSSTPAYLDQIYYLIFYNNQKNVSNIGRNLGLLVRGVKDN
jgi:SPP1 family predicted phage head-tail adaptor